MKNIFQNKKIILGVTGSIAAYKSPLIVRELIKKGALVQVIMTKSACQFVTPLVLSNLSRNKVIIDMFDEDSQTGGAWHIHTAHECDLMLIAPCSATSMGKLAHGICDNPLITVATALPREIPLVISPAMDSTMWLHPSTQRNLETLKNDGCIVIPPADGDLSSGLVGPGRLPEINEIIDFIENVLSGNRGIKTSVQYSDKYDDLKNKPIESISESIDKDRFNAELDFELLKKKLNRIDLFGKKVIITAGPTIEKIDDVRFISNFSTGKMGFALAESAQKMGAYVTLISGPVHIETPHGVTRINVQSAEEMYQTVIKFAEDYDIAILSAAVADFTPKNTHNGKLKKENLGDAPTIELSQTKDILRELGKIKKTKQILVGFALESSNGIENALKKIESKNCDLIILNYANKPDSGFGGDKNTISIIDKNATQKSLQAMSKSDCAEEILKYVAEKFRL